MGGFPTTRVLWLLCLTLASCSARSLDARFGDDVPEKEELLELSIIHMNDFHARFEETAWNSGNCNKEMEETCVGGIARVYTTVKQLMEERPNAIFLNAGDTFQGTLWYSVYKWNVTAEFMNKLPHDAITLGNHEFDSQVAGVVPYVEKLNCPVVVANLDASEEPSLQGKFYKSVVIERQGRKIGIVGYVLKSYPDISSTGKLKFTDEVEAVTAEAAKLKAQGVDIIIGLSHAGLEVDEEVAARVPDIDLIVGGHSHTLLYTGTPPGGDVAVDVYPVVVKQSSGRRVPIVQSYAFTKYIGNLTIRFDQTGEAVFWEGNPILQDHSVQPDAGILSDLVPWKDGIAELGATEVGTTKVLLDMRLWVCSRGECNLGNFVTDAMVEEYVDRDTPGAWTYAPIGVTNSGGIRVSIEETNKGVITYSDLVAAQPFENTIDTIEMQGRHVLQMLEQAVSHPYTTRSGPPVFVGFGFLQLSGIHVSFDVGRPVGSRVVDVKLRCAECRVPKYEPLDMDQWYRLAMPSFLVNGGDSYSVIRDNHRNRKIGRLDIDIFVDYLAKNSPITTGLDGRITLV